MSLKERVAIISGATGGLGRVATQGFAKAGANLALLGRDKKKLEALQQELDLSDEQSLILVADAGNPQDLSRAEKAVLEKFGRIDILLNLVGGWIGGKTLIESELEEIDNMLQQHVRASFLMIKAFVPHMLNNHWGRVLTISSPSASNHPGS